MSNRTIRSLGSFTAKLFSRTTALGRGNRWRPNLQCLEDRTLLSGGLDLTFNGTGKQTVVFNLGGENDDQARDVAVQSDAKVVLVGYGDRGGGDKDFTIARLNADGTRDAGFGADGKRAVPFNLGGTNDDRASGVAVQPDGKIVVVGYAQLSASDYDFAVLRLFPDGTPDITFGPGGQRTVGFNLGGPNDDKASGVVLQPDGKILVVGYAHRGGSDYDFAVARLNVDGTRDAGFGADGKRTIAFNIGGSGNFDQANAVAVQPDGKIVVAGVAQVAATDVDFAVVRIFADGTPDISFGPSGQRTLGFDLGGANSDVATGVVVQPDGKVVLAGCVQATGGNYDFGVARLSADGLPDISFDVDARRTISFNLGGDNHDIAQGVALQPDGKIVVAGNARVAANNHDFAVARLNTNGSSDTSFDTDGQRTVPFDLGGNNVDLVYGVAITPGGKIVLAGAAEKAPGLFQFAVARLEGANVHFLAVGGAPNRVQVFSRAGASLGTFSPFAGYNDAVAVALGDVNSDGIDDLIISATIGNPAVKIYSGATLSDGTFFINPESHALASGFAYGVNFNVGANIATGDVNGDGFADIITGAVPGNPHVKVFDGKKILASRVIPTGDDPSLLAQGFAYGTNFNVGANVATGDINGDGLADVITGASGGNPHTRVFDAKAFLVSKNIPTNNTAGVLAEFFPYGINFNVGSFVAAADYNRDGFADVVTGASIGNPEVRVFSGKDMAKGIFNISTGLLDFYQAFEVGQNIGVSVAASDFNGDGKADVLVGTRSGTPRHRVFQNNLPNPATILPGFDVIDSTFSGALSVGA